MLDMILKASLLSTIDMFLPAWVAGGTFFCNWKLQQPYK